MESIGEILNITYNVNVVGNIPFSYIYFIESFTIYVQKENLSIIVFLCWSLCCLVIRVTVASKNEVGHDSSVFILENNLRNTCINYSVKPLVEFCTKTVRPLAFFVEGSSF